MPRPTATMSGACVRSTADLASLKSSSGLVRICSGLSVDGDGVDGSFAASVGLDEIGAKRSSLK